MVYVPLYYVPIQASVQPHATLQIHLAAHHEVTKVRFLQRFVYGRHRVLARLGKCHHREADTIVRNALVYFKLLGKRTAERNMQVAPLAFQVGYTPQTLYDSREHGYLL